MWCVASQVPIKLVALSWVSLHTRTVCTLADALALRQFGLDSAPDMK